MTLRETIIRFRNEAMEYLIVHWRWFLVCAAALVFVISIVEHNADLVPAFFSGVTTGILCAMGAMAEWRRRGEGE